MVEPQKEQTSSEQKPASKVKKKKKIQFSKLYPDFIIERDLEKCIKCKICIRECTYGAHGWDKKREVLTEDHSK